jgi:hypothetical protein
MRAFVPEDPGDQRTVSKIHHQEPIPSSAIVPGRCQQGDQPTRYLAKRGFASFKDPREPPFGLCRPFPSLMATYRSIFQWFVPTAEAIPSTSARNWRCFLVSDTPSPSFN